MILKVFALNLKRLTVMDYGSLFLQWGRQRLAAWQEVLNSSVLHSFSDHLLHTQSIHYYGLALCYHNSGSNTWIAGHHLIGLLPPTRSSTNPTEGPTKSSANYSFLRQSGFYISRNCHSGLAITRLHYFRTPVRKPCRPNHSAGHTTPHKQFLQTC